LPGITEHLEEGQDFQQARPLHRYASGLIRVAVKDRLRLDTLDCLEQERDQREVFCCNKCANPPLVNLLHIIGLMCGGFASLMPLSNNYFCKPAAFSGLHVGQD
jgi:hypothetical protein